MSSREPLSVLLVEDDDVDALWIKKMLRDHDRYAFFAHRVRSLSEALEALDRILFHVILLDLNLPDSKGIQTVIEILQTDSSTPVLILSGMESSKVSDTAREAGFIDYLVKGKATRSEILQSIDSVMAT